MLRAFNRAFILAAQIIALQAAAESITVGVYQNRPKVFIDTNGNPSGFFIDILQTIAREENWRLDYEHDTWSGCMEKLRTGKIDLMVDVAYSLERDRQMDFNRESVLWNWSRLYTRKGIYINDLFDLEGKTIAAVNEDIAQQQLSSLLNQYQISSHFNKVESFQQAIDCMVNKKADAALVSRLFGLDQELSHNVKKTFLIMSPFELRFAAPAGQNQKILAAIDRHLSRLKAENDSAYYRALKKWIDRPAKNYLPPWFAYVVATAIFLIFALGLFTVVFKIQLSRSTRQLRENNRTIEHINCVLRGIRDVNQLIIREKDRQKLISTACDNLTRTHGFVGAWIVLTDGLPGKIEYAQSGFDNDLFRKLVNMVQDHKYPPCCSASRKADSAIIIGNPSDSGACGDCPLGLSYAGKSALASRLDYNEKRFGCFGLAVEPEFVQNKEELAFVNEIANDLAYALNNIEMVVEREKAEIKLEENKALLDATGKMAKVGGWELDAETQTVTWTGETYRIHEVPPDYTIDLQEAINFFHPKEREKLSAAIKNALENGFGYDLELRFITAKGRRLWTRTLCKPIIKNGKVTRLQGVFQDVTERKASEQKLKDAEEEAMRERNLALNIIEHGPIGIVIMNNEGVITDANQRAEQVLGLQGKSLKGRSYDAAEWRVTAVDGTHFPENQLPFRRVMDTSQPVHDVVHAIEHPDRRRRILSISATPLKNARGEVQQVVCSVEDITDHKESELKLKENEERLHLALSGAQLGTWDWNIQTGTVKFDERWAGMLGYPVTELEPHIKTWEKLVHPDDLPETQEALDAHIKGETDTYEAEYRMQHKLGNWVWIMDRGKIIERDRLGNPVRACGTHLDVTDQKQAYERLRQSEEKYRFIIENTRDMAYSVDNGGIITFLGPQARRYGVDPDEAVGEYILDFVAPEDKKRVAAEFEKTMKEEMPFTSQFRIVGADGEIYWLEEESNLLYNDAGSLTGLSGILRDITARKAAEEERNNFEAQLRQAQKLESIGTLAGGVAHEINNPINGIVNYAQLILDKAGPQKEISELASEITKETERVSTIVKNLLSFARQEKHSHSKAHLKDIVSDTLSLVNAVMRHDQIRLEVHVPEDLPMIRCRSQQIQQVIMNLITNARDALNEKYPEANKNKKITIHAQVQVKGGCDWIRLTVEDFGTGVSKEVQQRMFDPFYTTKARDKGTGLGLSITHGIIKEHGGKLHFETKPGEWTRVHMDLPVNGAD